MAQQSTPFFSLQHLWALPCCSQAQQTHKQLLLGDPSDWPAVLASNSIAVKGYKADPVNSHSDDKWDRGTQPVDPVNKWHWKNGNVNDKEDMGNTGYAIIGHNLYFFADLHANNGDASIGLWLLKDNVQPTAGGDFTGSHTNGDILVSLAFTNGHKTATPTIYVWQNGALRLVPLNPNDANAATNLGNVASPWPYSPKKGTDGIYPATTFFEGFINLDNVPGGFDPCIGRFVFLTWESQSEHAAESDMVIGGTTRITVTAQDTMVCSGSIVPLTGSPAGGTWSGYGVVGNTFDATSISAGCYTVTYWMYNPSGCVSSACAKVTVKNCYCGCWKHGVAGVEPSMYTLSPNPSNGIFDVYLPPLASDAEATVADIYGRVVDKRTISKSETGQDVSYDLSKIGSGIYFIRVENKDVHYTEKMIVQ